MKIILILSLSKMKALIIKNYLDQMNIGKVFWTKSYQEALKIQKNHKIDLILSDVDLGNITIFDCYHHFSSTHCVCTVDYKNLNELKSWFNRAQIQTLPFPFSSVELKEALSKRLDKERLLDLPI